jgi:cysteinyl-tRNA synthetase
MFFLFSHYASPVDFTDDKIKEAHKALDRFDILFWKASEIIKDKKIFRSIETEFLKIRKAEFLKSMDDDFNTPKALAAIFDLISDTNKFIEQEKNDQNYVDIVHNCVDTIERYTREVFGLFLAETDKDLSEEDRKLLETRAKARSGGDFKKSDELRDALKKRGIVVEDTKNGQVWRWV